MQTTSSAVIALASGWNAGGSLSAWVFVGVFLHDNCRWRAHLLWKALENRDVTSGRWWTWILCWWVEGAGGTAVVIEQWIENALVSQGRAEGWAILSREETLAECGGLTHLTTCFSRVSHLTVTNIKWNSSQAGEQVWEPEVCAVFCVWFGEKYQSPWFLFLLCSVVLCFTSIPLQKIRVVWNLTQQQFPGHEDVKN